MAFFDFRDRPPLLVLLGQTAVGKTALSLKLAAHFNGEIISADSRLFYRGMDIGTGKDLPQLLKIAVDITALESAAPKSSSSMSFQSQEPRRHATSRSL